MCNIWASGEIDFDITPTTVLICIYIYYCPQQLVDDHIFFSMAFCFPFLAFLLELYHHLMSPNHLKLNAVCCFQQLCVSLFSFARTPGQWCVVFTNTSPTPTTHYHQHITMDGLTYQRRGQPAYSGSQQAFIQSLLVQAHGCDGCRNQQYSIQHAFLGWRIFAILELSIMSASLALLSPQSSRSVISTK